MPPVIENYKIVPVLSNGDLNAGANLDTDSINMANYHSALFICGFQTIGGADTHLYVYSGASDGTCTTSLTFYYRFGGAAQGSANCDVFGAWTSAAGPLHITHGTYDNYTLQVFVPASAMTSGHKWLTMRMSDTDTGSTGNVQVHAILDPRYGSNASVTALA